MEQSLKKLARAAGLVLGVFAVVSIAGVIKGAESGVLPPESDCAAAQVRAAGKKAYQIAVCYAHALEQGKPVSEQCLSDRDRKFRDGFNDGLDAGDCLGPVPALVSAGTIERKVDCTIEDVVCELSGNSGCTPCYGGDGGGPPQ